MSAGTCIFCGCTEDSACRLPNGDPCSWMNNARTRCNNPLCILAAEAMKRKHDRELLALRKRAARALTPAQIWIRRKRERNRKRRRTA